jgi:hypothetical protein
MEAVRIDARRALLERLIDHAPLFPPAQLPMAEALAEDRRARASSEAWMVGRFVCPASRLAELGDVRVPLSVVLDADARLDDARIEAVEVPPQVQARPDVRELYVEIPTVGMFEERIHELAATGRRAKVRCGGAQVPTVEELARFVRACRDEGVLFKATAGLHHAVRGPDEHGFLNLLAAVVFGDEEEALADEDASAFALTAERFSWRGRQAGPEALASARRDAFAGFGSCSFFEPVEELRALGVLPVA